MNNEQMTPAVDMPCTVVVGSDRYAAKIVRVLKTSVDVERAGEIERFHFGRGKFRDGSSYLHLGEAEDYMDPCF